MTWYHTGSTMTHAGVIVSLNDVTHVSTMSLYARLRSVRNLVNWPMKSYTLTSDVTQRRLKPASLRRLTRWGCSKASKWCWKGGKRGERLCGKTCPVSWPSPSHLPRAWGAREDGLVLGVEGLLVILSYSLLLFSPVFVLTQNRTVSVELTYYSIEVQKISI